LGEGKPPGVTVAAFYPGTRGAAVLESLGVAGPVRTALVDLGRGDPEAANRLFQAWNAASPEVRQGVIADVRALLPELRAVSDSEIISHLTRYRDSLPLLKLEGLIELGLNRLPADLREQLADMWAVYTVLGIKDPHDSNWLYWKGKVAGIDMALSPSAYAAGRASLKLDGGFDPIGFSGAPARRFLLSHVSPALKAYLAGLSDQEIQALARSNGYNLTDGALQGIRERANLIVRGIFQ
jgi:hypothetical protein